MHGRGQALVGFVVLVSGGAACQIESPEPEAVQVERAALVGGGGVERCCGRIHASKAGRQRCAVEAARGVGACAVHHHQGEHPRICDAGTTDIAVDAGSDVGAGDAGGPDAIAPEDTGPAPIDVAPPVVDTGPPPPVCGNALVETGEDCDPPDGVACDLSCHHIARCGDGVVDPGEQCDPPHPFIEGGPPGCDSSCQTILCGNGRIDPGEGCDPPRTSPPLGTPACSATCQVIDACTLCEASLGAPTCGGAADAVCAAVESCIRMSGCALSRSQTSPLPFFDSCYCGTYPMTCFRDGVLLSPVMGPCKAQFEAAAGSSDPAVVGRSLVDTSTTLGRGAAAAAAGIKVPCIDRFCTVNQRP